MDYLQKLLLFLVYPIFTFKSPKPASLNLQHMQLATRNDYFSRMPIYSLQPQYELFAGIITFRYCVV